MDPQKLSQLDPKLRDAYQRVMGTPVPPPQADPVQAQTPPPPPMPTPDPVAPSPEPPTQPAEPIVEPPISEPSQPAVPNPQPLTPEPPVSEPEPLMPEPPASVPPEPSTPPTETPVPEPTMPQQPPMQASNFDQMHSEVASAPSANFTTPSPISQTIAVKKNNGMLPILFGIVGFVFLAVYTLFWTKIFNLKLPFLP